MMGPHVGHMQSQGPFKRETGGSDSDGDVRMEVEGEKGKWQWKQPGAMPLLEESHEPGGAGRL